MDANYGMMVHASFDEFADCSLKYGEWKPVTHTSFDELINVSAGAVEQQEIIAQLKADVLDLKKEARKKFGVTL